MTLKSGVKLGVTILKTDAMAKVACGCSEILKLMGESQWWNYFSVK